MTRPRVLVVRLDSDGDVLLAGPAIRAVAAGAEHVALLCSPRGRQAAALLPGVDEILVHRAPWMDPEPPPVDRAATLELVDELMRRDFDQALILTSFHQSPLPTALLLRLADVPVVAAISEDYPGSLLDVRHRVSDDLHEVERSLSVVATLGFHLPPDDPGDLQVAGVEPAPAFLDGVDVVVHPGASVPARAWPAERHRALVEELVSRGHAVAVTGGPDEEPLTAAVAEGTGALDAGGRTTLPQLAGLLAAARCVVVGNTGPAHLAAAVGTPVVSLYANTIPPLRFRPWRVGGALLVVDVPCAGCRARVCPVPGHPCLTAIATPRVVAAVDAHAIRSSLRTEVAS
jgi:ADP-heptose:LPS heptosyltransferase